MGAGGGWVQSEHRKCRRDLTNFMPTSSPVDMCVPVGAWCFNKICEERPLRRRDDGVQATESNHSTPGAGLTSAPCESSSHDHGNNQGRPAA